MIRTKKKNSSKSRLFSEESRPPITTRFSAPNKDRSCCIITKCGDSEFFTDYHHNRTVDENHIAAAGKMCKQLGLHGYLVSKSIGEHYYHIIVTDLRKKNRAK